MRWPLHPKPHPYETLERYIRRLAECYGVRYETFCLNALGIAISDGQARRFKQPEFELLKRLSDGTGIPVETLEQMNLKCIWERLLKELAETDVK